MLQPRPFAHTRFALAVFGIVGTMSLAGLGAAMFVFPSAMRPVMPVLINGVAARAGLEAPYRVEDYAVWAWLIVIAAVIFGLSALVLYLRRPAEDRRIDAVLRSRLEHAVRGAPTEQG